MGRILKGDGSGQVAIGANLLSKPVSTQREATSADSIQTATLEGAERHYRGLSQIKDICVIPLESSDPSRRGLFAVVVPDAAELTARQVASARERVGELLLIAGCVLAPALRIAGFVLVDEPLPRSPSGELHREKVAKWFQRPRKGPNGDDSPAETPAQLGRVLEHPASQRFFRRLEEVLGVKGPFSPSHDLETDLGMDSLTQVQFRIVLEEEFGVEVAHGELWRIRTVADVLTRVVETSLQQEVTRTDISWSRQLRQPPAESLEQRFPLKRGLMSWAAFWCLTRLVGLLLRVFFRATIVGLDKLPRSGAVILAPNHLSYLDSPLLYSLLPARLIARTFFLGYREIFREPPLSRVVRACRLILTGDAESLLDSLRLCREALGRGLAVCIFPEGIRSTSGTIMKARPGVGMLACETQCPIVPILIEGSEKTMSPPHPGFRLCRVRLTVGDPIPPPRARSFTVEDYQALADRWQEAVLRMQARSGGSKR